MLPEEDSDLWPRTGSIRLPGDVPAGVALVLHLALESEPFYSGGDHFIEALSLALSPNDAPQPNIRR